MFLGAILPNKEHLLGLVLCRMRSACSFSILVTGHAIMVDADKS